MAKPPGRIWPVEDAPLTLAGALGCWVTSGLMGWAWGSRFPTEPCGYAQIGCALGRNREIIT